MELLNADCAHRARLLLRAVIDGHPHLSYTQLEALAEGRLAARGVLAAHIRECQICACELRELKSFVRSFQTAAPVTRLPWHETVRSWFERPLQLVGAAATVAVLAAGLCLLQSESRRAASGGAVNHPAAAYVAVNDSTATEDCKRREAAHVSAEQGTDREIKVRCQKQRVR